MPKKYDIEDLGIIALVGRTISAAYINESKDLVILNTDKGMLYMTWTGGDEADCRITNFHGIENFIGRVLDSVNNTGWTRTVGPDNKVTDTMRTEIKTSSGDCAFLTARTHSGYYGGEIRVSSVEPIDQYNSSLYPDDEASVELEELHNF